MKVIQSKRIQAINKFVYVVSMILIISIMICIMLFDTVPLIASGGALVIGAIAAFFILIVTLLMCSALIVYKKNYRSFDVYCSKVLKLNKMESEVKEKSLIEQALNIFEHAKTFKSDDRLRFTDLINSTPYRFEFDEKVFIVNHLEALGMKFEVDKLGVLHYTI